MTIDPAVSGDAGQKHVAQRISFDSDGPAIAGVLYRPVDNIGHARVS